MITAGDLDQRITIQQRSPVADGYGGDGGSWTTLATVWAAVKPLNGRERIQAQQEQSEVLYRVWIRRRGDVTAGMRVVWRGAAMNIRAVPDAGPRSEWLVLDCERGVPT